MVPPIIVQANRMVQVFASYLKKRHFRSRNTPLG